MTRFASSKSVLGFTRGVRFVREPKEAPYGTVAAFEDLNGNRWDLVGPLPSSSNAQTGAPAKSGKSRAPLSVHPARW